jgi:hypothetical protein
MAISRGIQLFGHFLFLLDFLLHLFTHPILTLTHLEFAGALTENAVGKLLNIKASIISRTGIK